MKTILIHLTLIILSMQLFSQNASNVLDDRTIEEQTLCVFIGKVLSHKYFDPNENLKQEPIIQKYDSINNEKYSIQKRIYIADNGYKIKFKVLKSINRKFKSDTIEFLAYDHNGKPEFLMCEYVLIYLSKSSNQKFVHHKYLFDPVFKNDQEEWKGLNGETIEELIRNKQVIIDSRKIK